MTIQDAIDILMQASDKSQEILTLDSEGDLFTVSSIELDVPNCNAHEHYLINGCSVTRRITATVIN